MRRRALRAGLVAGLLLSVAGCTPGPATLSVDTGERHQTMAGWEATVRLWEFDKTGDRFDGSWLAQRDALAAMLADEAGIDRLRLEIRSGAENPVDYWPQFVDGRIGYLEFKRHFYEKINDNDDPYRLDPAGVQFSELDWRVENIVLPVKARVEARGRRFRLNLAYLDFKWTAEKGSLSHAKHPQEYAELIVATMAHLKLKYGLSPDDLEIIVEPDNSVDWRGAEIGRAIKAIGPRLDAAGLARPAIIAPSTAQARRALGYFAALSLVPGAAAEVATLSYHRYEGAPGPTLLGMIRTAARAAGAKTAMLEYVDGDVDDLFDDLTVADATAWQQFGIAALARPGKPDRPGWLIIADPQPAKPAALALSGKARALAQIFTHVPQGSVRIGARSAASGLRSVGFLTPAGKVVLAFKSDAERALIINGLPPGRYRVTSDSRDSNANDARRRDIIVSGPLQFPAAAATTTTLVEL